LRHPNWANRAWNTGGDSYIHVGNGWRSRNDALYVRDVRGTDDTDNAGYLSDDHNCQFDRAGLAVRDTSYIVYDRFSRLDGTGSVIPASSGCICRDRNVRTGAINATESGPHLHDGQHSHDDARDCVGDHPHSIRRQHDRDSVTGVAAGQSIDYRVQFYTGGPSDKWRRFAALDPPSSERSLARRDSTRSPGTCRYQHRSDNNRGADAEYVGMRREHDDESGNSRHDGAGQRHGRRSNTGRIASSIAIGLLRPNSLPDALAQ
jgi:hypothetical protein